MSENESQELAVQGHGTLRRAASVVLEAVMDIAQAKKRLEQLRQFCSEYLQSSDDGGTDGGDYGIIPGAGKKKVLFKSGADKLCDVYGMADTYHILSKTEDFETGLFDYTIECRLRSKIDDSLIGTGLGSCSSFEAKYRWRAGGRVCPACGVANSVIKGKKEFGGGFICWAKKGGCGEKFSDNDPAITEQVVEERVPNPDIVDAKNTVLKMAKKRAKIDAVIGVTRSSGIFTQDVEDDELHAHTHGGDNGSSAKGSATDPHAGLSHADKIKAIKAEAEAKKQGKGKPAGEVIDVEPVKEPVKEPAKEPVKDEPKPEKPKPETKVANPDPTPDVNTTPAEGHPAEPAAAQEPVAEAPAQTPAGEARVVRVLTVNTVKGADVVKQGKKQPAWGPYYAIKFSAPITMPDGAAVDVLMTELAATAQIAQSYHDDNVPCAPTGVAGNRKGVYRLSALNPVPVA